MAERIKQFFKGFQTYTKQTQFYQNRLPIIAENTEKDLMEFLTLIIYYNCVGCGVNVDGNFNINYPR